MTTEPRSDTILTRFFRDFPRLHLFKFFVDRHRQRAVWTWLFKTLVYGYFKVKNRLTIVGREHVPAHGSGSFLIVENHVAHVDVVMHAALWARLGFPTFTFVSASSFSPAQPFYTAGVHFAEMIPRVGPGRQCVRRMVDRLVDGDVVNIFPAGTYPAGEFVNSGLVQEGFSGAVRVAHQYERRTRTPLRIVPTCSIGANRAYPPRRSGPREPATKILVKIGAPFTLPVPDAPTYEDIREQARQVQLAIARLWGQRRLIPNRARARSQSREHRTYGTRAWKRKRRNTR